MYSWILMSKRLSECLLHLLSNGSLKSHLTLQTQHSLVKVLE